MDNKDFTNLSKSANILTKNLETTKILNNKKTTQTITITITNNTNN